MRKTFKYRLYPTRAQSDFLAGQLREACDLYNCALQERISAWKTCRKSISYFDQTKQLKAMRMDGCLILANYCCCQDVLRRLDKAFTAFYARVRRGERPGFPRFKPWRRYDSITFPIYGNGCRLKGRLLHVQGCGEVKVKLHRPVDGRIKTATIRRESGHWFVCFSAECESQPLRPCVDPIGIDIGITTFATFSNGVAVDNPRFFMSAERELRIAQRRLARRKNKHSNRRRKAVQTLQRVYNHVQSQRRDFHHKISSEIVRNYGTIVVEDLNIKGLSSGMLAKQVHDAGWGNFLNMLAYKAESAGREFVKVNPRGTSQTCLCGARVPKGLSDRWHSCKACGLEGSRDHVSAKIILSRAGTRPSAVNVERLSSCVGREAVRVR